MYNNNMDRTRKTEKDHCFCWGQMLSPLGGSGSEVVNWNVKQTGTPVRAVSMAIGRGGAAENGGGVVLMMCGGKGGVAPGGNPWYVVLVVTCGWFVPPISMITSISVSPGCSETSVSGRTCTVSALIESCAGSESGIS